MHTSIKILTQKAGFLPAAAFVVLFSSFAITKAPVNFSGEWKLNESKSELGQFPQFAPRKVNVTASDTAATVVRFSVGQDGQERNSTETLSYNGKETESTVFGAMKKKSSVKWSDDGKTMTVNGVINFERDGQSSEIKVKEDWKLSDYGKTLTIASASSSSFGDNSMKMVFDKAQ
jgi:hypothetical protein